MHAPTINQQNKPNNQLQSRAQEVRVLLDLQPSIVWNGEDDQKDAQAAAPHTAAPRERPHETLASTYARLFLMPDSMLRAPVIADTRESSPAPLNRMRAAVRRLHRGKS